MAAVCIWASSMVAGSDGWLGLACLATRPCGLADGQSRPQGRGRAGLAKEAVPGDLARPPPMTW